MKSSEAHDNFPDSYHDVYSKTVFGFWIYLLTDFVLFGTLFATHAVLQRGTFGGPSAADLFNLPYTFVQTLILLVSSFTIGMAGASAHRRHKKETLTFFGITFVLGIVFMGMMLYELAGYIHAGSGWQRSAFLSAYYTIVGTFAVHLLFALLWVLVLVLPVWRSSLTENAVRRLTCLKMFWQFLNIIWIFIFSFVYLMGVKIV